MTVGDIFNAWIFDMSNGTARDNDISRLHPAIRENVREIVDQLHQEGFPFEVFEAFRTPERQANLFAQGRTAPGDKVTWVGPWRSMHQYGLAVDLVLKIGGDWSWDDSGANAPFWPRMHEIAKAQGMTALFNKKGQLIELPHIQLAGLSTDGVYRGGYPPGGDTDWAEHLSDLIDNWSGSAPPPPKPVIRARRPTVDESDAPDLEDTISMQDAMSGQSGIAGLSTSEAEARFHRLHAFIRRWEGGFSNHPADNGGATNMGITQATLADWRNRQVSVEDVRNLGRAEADAILRTNYYATCRCGELPDRTAIVVYNGAVLHGPRTSIKFLQSAFNALGLMVNGKPLDVDGIIGDDTMEAAQKTDASTLANAYMNIQDAHFRNHEDFATFGKGWLNRLAALREFVATLPRGAGMRPATSMKITETEPVIVGKDGLADILSKGTKDVNVKQAIGVLFDGVLRDGTNDTAEQRRQKAVLRTLLGLGEQLAPALLPGTVVITGDGKPALTPVNAALGNGIGHLLDGKKSVIGVVGLLLTVFLPEIGLSGSLIDFIREQSPNLITVLATFTGWGFLGKIDKAIRLNR